MPLDWNWFFSTTSQSTAAIVGIFAAFIITKIINNQSEFNKKLNLIKDHLNTSEFHLMSLNTISFAWYNKVLLEKALKKMIKSMDMEDDYTYEDYYAAYDFPTYMSKDELMEIIHIVVDSAYNKNYGDIKKIEAKYEIEVLPSTVVFSISVAKIKQEGISSIRKNIDSNIVGTKHHIGKIRHLLGDVQSNPESSQLVTNSIIAIFLLFFIGVIYPLSFIPLAGEPIIEYSISAFFVNLCSLKGGILFATSLIFSGIMIVFLIINNNLKYDKELIGQLKHYSDISNYSEYLQNMQEQLKE